MRASGKLKPLTDNICKGIKSTTVTGDSLSIIPFAAESTITHTVRFDNRIDLMGICKPENFADYLTGADITDDVAAFEGTNLYQAVQQLPPDTVEQVGGTGEAKPSGKVIIVLVHADDPGVGADKAVSIDKTAKALEQLLTDKNAALVVFALDGNLRRGLQASLQHPQALVSPLSTESIEGSLQWAYELARSPVDDSTNTAHYRQQVAR